MKVVWAGTFEPDFSRNRRIGRLLSLGDIEVRIVRESVWPSDRLGLVVGGRGRTALAALTRYPKLLFRLLATAAPDTYLVSYPGWFDMIVVRIAARLKRRPVVFDPFISLYDTMVTDRGLRSERSFLARMAMAIDRWSLRLADRVLADTEAHLELYDTIVPGVRERGDVLPLGADDQVFFPRPEIEVDPSLVVFHGTFVPLQGVETIVEAAALMAQDGLRTIIVGDGQTRPAIEDLVARSGTSIEMPGLLPLEDLPSYLARAAVCLGIFGSSDKAGRVVPHKLYECLAMGRPVVTRDGPAIRSLFDDDEVDTVPPSDPTALAAAIQSLIGDSVRREQLAANGLTAYRERYHERSLSALLTQILGDAVR